MDDEKTEAASTEKGLTDDDGGYDPVPFPPAKTVRVRYVPGEPMPPLPRPEDEDASGGPPL